MSAISGNHLLLSTVFDPSGDLLKGLEDPNREVAFVTADRRTFRSVQKWEWNIFLQRQEQEKEETPLIVAVSWRGLRRRLRALCYYNEFGILTTAPV